MSTLLYCDLSNKKLRRSLGGAEFSFGTIPHIGTITLGLRFSKQVGTRHIEIYPTVAEIRASIGPLDQRPAAGQFSLKVGGGSPVAGTNVTTLLNWNSTADEIQAALRVLTGLSAATVVEDRGTFLVTGVAATIAVYENTLRPICFVRVQSYEVGSALTQSIRLQVAPFAFTGVAEERVPDPPTVERIQAGAEIDGTVYPEIQKLTIPLEFNGSYRLRRSDPLRKSPLLGVGDGPDEIATAINPTSDSIGLADDVDGIFEVEEHPTEPANLISFMGSMLGASPEEIEVEVFDPPPADHWIHLNPQTAMTEEALRDTNLIRRVPVEIHADLAIDGMASKRYCLYRGECSIQEAVTHNDLATLQHVDWINPPDAKSYPPVEADSLSSGVRFYPFVIGNASDIEFQIPHNLATPRAKVHLRENATGGRDLVHGTDYEVVHDNGSAATITLLGTYASSPPALDALTGTVQDLTLTSTWLNPTVPIGNVTGLQALLDAILAKLAALELLSPSQFRSQAFSTGQAVRKPLPYFGFIYPQIGRGGIAVPVPGTRLGTLDAATFPRVAPRLAGAVHDAAVETLPTTLDGGIRVPVDPSPEQVGAVFENETSDPVDLAVGTGWELAPGDWAATDGEDWWPAMRYDDGESSYYPAHLERLLWEDMIQPDELPEGAQMEVRFPVELAMLMANTPMHCQVVIETAHLTEDTAPGTPGSNLAARVWAAPHLAQDLRITSVPREYVFGYRVRRAKTGELSADRLTFGKWVATTAPASAAFSIRARLIRWDTPNTIAVPTGLIAVVGGVPFADNFSPDQSDAVGFLKIS